MKSEPLADWRLENWKAKARPIHVRHCASLPLLFVSLLLALLAGSLSAADAFNWNTNQNRVSADIKSSSLLSLLEQIAVATRWQVFVEPETLHTVSAKFENLPPGEALRLLLGDV